MPLTMAKAGETVTIQKITGKDEVRLHLAELGFVVGETITVVSEISGTIETKNTVRYLVSIINLVVVLLSINDNFLIIQDNDQFGKYYFKGSPQGGPSLLPYALTLFYIHIIHILKFVLFCQIRPIL